MKNILASIEKQWVEPFGDMRQELVFIGQGLDQSGMTKALDECLLSEEMYCAVKPTGRHCRIHFLLWEQA